MKVSELSGAALDWAVAKCEGWTRLLMWANDTKSFWYQKEDKSGIYRKHPWELNYSTDWVLGGPIIAREGISWHCGNKTSWHAYAYGSSENISGPTPLIAAMRCYVASKLGDAIEIPKELT